MAQAFGNWSFLLCSIQYLISANGQAVTIAATALSHLLLYFPDPGILGWS